MNNTIKSIRRVLPLQTTCAIYLLLAALALPAQMQAQFTCSTNNGTITITGYTGSDGIVIIPDMLNGLPVTSIGSYAFYSLATVTNVTVPDSITSIGFAAFNYCSCLTNITIGAGVTNIGAFVFESCGSLASIDVNPTNSFYCSLDGVLFDNPRTILLQFPSTKAGSYTIPNTVSSVADAAFSRCYSLAAVTIPDSVTNIGNGAFWFCSSLTNAALGSGVVNIGASAFCSCSNISGVTLPVGLTTIGNQAFWDCTSLTNFTIPNTVTNISSTAFESCTNITAFTLAPFNPSFTTIDGVLFDINRNTLIEFPAGKTGNYNIPEGVVSVADYSFSGSMLSSVTIPSTVTNLGIQTFSYCSGLTNVIIKSGLACIGGNDFANCISLLTVSLPNTVTNIGYNAFQSCGNLALISLPNNLVSIGNSAFSGCSNLQALAFPNSLKTIGSSAFLSCKTLSSALIPDAVTNLGDYAFHNCSSLSNVVLGAGIRTLGRNSFSHCNALTTITIPDLVSSIGDDAFFSCSSLSVVRLGAGVTSIGSSTFYACANLEALCCMGPCPFLGPSALSGTRSTVYYLPGSTGWVPTYGGRPTGLWDIATQAGYLTNSTFSTFNIYLGTNSAVIVPSSFAGKPVTSIAPSAFASCASLVEVTIPATVTSLGSYAFASCNNLTSLYFQGNAPPQFQTLSGDYLATVYYLPGTLGWYTTFDARPTAVWKPKIQTADGAFGIRTNRFGFNITWTSGTNIVIEACDDLAGHTWSPLQTNTLIGNSLYFSDPAWTNYPARLYRLRSP